MSEEGNMMTGTWRGRMPRGVTDPLGPRGEPIATPADRRLLWHIESMLAVRAPAGSDLAALARDLRAYLNETCEHHWLEYAESRWEHPDATEADAIPPHRQCLWCHDVEWTADQPSGEA